jgi:hypothetical protein
MYSLQHSLARAGGGGGGGKQIQEDWKVVLGETALDIQCGNVSTAADGTGVSGLGSCPAHNMINPTGYCQCSCCTDMSP